MAQRWMFSLAVVDTDAFLNLPVTAQCLYFHLGMHGDDDGFVDNPRKIMRAVGCSESDLHVLEDKRFIIMFDSGVIVIRDWKLNNTLKNDRYHPSVYSDERNMLSSDKSGRYFIVENSMEPGWNQDGTNLEPERNLTQQNQTEPNPTETNGTKGSAEGERTNSPTLDEITAYAKSNWSALNDTVIREFFYYYAQRDWIEDGKPVDNWEKEFDRWVSAPF